MLRLLLGLSLWTLPVAAQVDSTAVLPPASDGSLAVESLPSDSVAVAGPAEAGDALGTAPSAHADSTDRSAETPAMEPPAAERTVAATPPVRVPTGRSREPILGHVFGYLLPGGGHFYAGETGTGLVLLGTFAGGYAFALSGLLNATLICPLDGDGTCRSSGGAEVALLWGAAMVVGASIYSVVDGGRAVRRANVRNGYLPGGGRPAVALSASPAGVAMRVRL